MSEPVYLHLLQLNTQYLYLYLYQLLIGPLQKALKEETLLKALLWGGSCDVASWMIAMASQGLLWCC